MATFKIKKADRVILDKLLEQLEGAKGAIVEKLTEIHADWEAKYDLKSEKWQEGENGEAAQARIDELAELRDAVEEMAIDGDLDGLS